MVWGTREVSRFLDRKLSYSNNDTKPYIFDIEEFKKHFPSINVPFERIQIRTSISVVYGYTISLLYNNNALHANHANFACGVIYPYCWNNSNNYFDALTILMAAMNCPNAILTGKAVTIKGVTAREGLKIINNSLTSRYRYEGDRYYDYKLNELGAIIYNISHLLEGTRF